MAVDAAVWKAKVRFLTALVTMPVPHHFHTGAWHESGAIRRRRGRLLFAPPAAPAAAPAAPRRRRACRAGRGPARGHAPGPRAAKAEGAQEAEKANPLIEAMLQRKQAPPTRKPSASSRARPRQDPKATPALNNLDEGARTAT